MRFRLLLLIALAGCAESPYYTVRKPASEANTPVGVTHESGIFEAARGVHLFEQSWHPAGAPRGVLMIVHGLKDYSGHYAAAATELAEHGYAVYAFDLRGHGLSEGHRVWIDSFDDYLDDLDVFAKRVAARESGKPIFLFGHSMGGAIVTLYTLKVRPPLDGLILSGPALKRGSDISGFLAGVTRFLGTVAPKLAVLDLENRWFSRDPKVVADMNTDPLVYNKPGPARTAAQLLGAMSCIQDREATLDVPVLVMHGTADRLTNPDGSKELAARARTADKTLKLYEGYYHDLLHEPDRAIVLGDMERWLDAHAGGMK